ncbi:MAG: hypothetical protein VXY93_13085, partial [Pseudomonadota bacterium]|nr:hypothetical protein [Pseudomonadota bacterium]
MAFTRVLGPGIHTASNINSHNINSTGIITAVSFVGNGAGLTGIASTDNIITGTAATFNTYPVDINAGMDVVGVSSFQDIDVDGHTNLDNVSVAGVTTFNGNVHLPTNVRLRIGNSNELDIYQQGNNTFILNNDDTFVIGQQGSGADHAMRIYGGSEFELKHMYSNGGQTSSFKSVRGGAFTLYHAGGNTPSADQIRLETTSTGLNFPRDIDVDGHTNLDNVSVAGVTTFAGTAQFNSTIGVHDGTTGGSGQYLRATGTGVTW